MTTPNVSEELKKNSRIHLLETLRYFSFADEQRRYERAVPFVHIPIELAAQWDNHSHLLHTQTWFKSLFSQDEYDALTAFDFKAKDCFAKFGRRLPELHAILEDAKWQQLGVDASVLLMVLGYYD